MLPLFIKSISKPKKQVKPKEEKADVTAGVAAKNPDLDHFTHLLGVVSSFKKDGDFGEHNVDKGHHVAFAAGAFTGSGKVASTGRDGVTVVDGKKREHRIHWGEITGHFVPEGSDGDSAKDDKKGKNAK